MLRRVFMAVLFTVFVSPAFAESVSITVDIPTQTMRVKVDGVTEYVWPVSTGKKGYRTPRGSYMPTRMHAKYFSRKYDNAPMPYSIFFTGGFAIHGTSHVRALGSPASHGCVRLQTANAQALFGLVKQYGRGNTSIRIKG